MQNNSQVEGQVQGSEVSEQDLLGRQGYMDSQIAHLRDTYAQTKKGLNQAKQQAEQEFGTSDPAELQAIGHKAQQDYQEWLRNMAVVLDRNAAIIDSVNRDLQMLAQKGE